jgi:hypothetical protein
MVTMLLDGDTADIVAVIDDDSAADNRVPHAQIRRPSAPERNGVLTHTSLLEPYEKGLVGFDSRSLGNHRFDLVWRGSITVIGTATVMSPHSWRQIARIGANWSTSSTRPCEVEDDLGENGKSGVLASMAARDAFLRDPSPCLA